MGAVVDPFVGGGDPLAGRNGCGMADHSHDITMPTHFGAQYAKAIVCVVVSDALNEARQYFLVCCFWCGFISGAHFLERPLTQGGDSLFGRVEI